MSSTVFYRIFCKNPQITDCYVGHTTDFRGRKYRHKSACTLENNIKYEYKVYQFIRNYGGWKNWNMEIIEDCNTLTLQQVYARERFWYETLNATLNNNIPNRNATEYYNDNKNEILQICKKKYRENTDTYKMRCKQYYEDNKEKILKKKKMEYQKLKFCKLFLHVDCIEECFESD